jgi:hypothetical protein
MLDSLVAHIGVTIAKCKSTPGNYSVVANFRPYLICGGYLQPLLCRILVQAQSRLWFSCDKRRRHFAMSSEITLYPCTCDFSVLFSKISDLVGFCATVHVAVHSRSIRKQEDRGGKPKVEKATFFSLQAVLTMGKSLHPTMDRRCSVK